MLRNDVSFWGTEQGRMRRFAFNNFCLRSDRLPGGFDLPQMRERLCFRDVEHNAPSVWLGIVAVLGFEQRFHECGMIRRTPAQVDKSFDGMTGGAIAAKARVD